MLVDFHDKGVGISDAMCTDSEGRLWRAVFFGATIVLVGPSHRRAVGQDRVPSPSHDVMLLWGGGGGRAPLMTSCCFWGPDLVDVCHQHCTEIPFTYVSVDDLLPLNKIMVFTVLEVSRQAILLSVVVVSAHRFNAIKQP